MRRGWNSMQFNVYHLRRATRVLTVRVHGLSKTSSAACPRGALLVPSALSACEPLRGLKRLANRHATSQCAILPRQFMVVPDVEMSKGQVPDSIFNDLRRYRSVGPHPPGHLGYNVAT